MPILYLVVPCYNEEEIIAESANRLSEKFDELIDKQIISSKSKIVFVNDGSHDRTFELLSDLCRAGNRNILISFTRNFGHQSAILA